MGKLAQLIDARTSQNASYADSIVEPILVVDEPQLVGQVGLNVTEATGPVTVQFSGTVSVQLPLALVGVTVTVVRGTEATDPLVYSTTETFSLSVLAPQVITFTGSDFEVEDPGDELVYTMFISASLLGTVRVGPESFNAAAYIED
jgi:hypothetical protein